MAKKAWVVAVDMGYGHQRAAHALKGLAFQGKVIAANDYPYIPPRHKAIWKETRQVYEFVSRFKKVPVLGDLVFALLDKVQEIKDFYPKEQGIEPPGFQVQAMYQLMEKQGWGEHLIEKLNEDPLPLIATFSVIAFMAEYWGYKAPIFLLATDSDAARAWVPLKAKSTKIKYCAPTERVAARLLQYGVPSSQISLTGFPLPQEFIKKQGLLQTKEDLQRRLAVLDPQRRYLTKYADVVRRYLGRVPEIQKARAPTITFAIGGAGAQQDLAEDILSSLAPLLKKGQVHLQIVAGTHQDAAQGFLQAAKGLGLSAVLGKELSIIVKETKDEYFKDFPGILRKTDILWTKPSELSFYAALGIPLLLSSPIGSQEVQNQEWLLKIGSGIKQLNPEFSHEWILDFINQGLFAEAAMQGYVEMERNGTANIASLVASSS